MRITSISSPARVLIGALVLITPAALGAATVSANAAAAPVTWTVQVGSQTKDMAVQGERFLPGDITIDAGDTVTWHADSAEPHTVTFVDGGKPQDTLAPFNPGDPTQNSVQGTDTMDGTSYYNSGVLTSLDALSILPFPVVHSYSLTFPDPGTYTYYCLIHGLMMRGVVHVQDAGAAYPSSQADIDSEAAWLAGAINADGRALAAQAKAASTNHKVLIGADDGVAMVMRFINTKVVVHKGEQVRFVDTSMDAPHTVTFGAPHPGPNILGAYGQPNSYKGGDLSSGAMAPHQTFTVTFKKAGTFHYVCLFHGDLGMKGLVVVKP
jgi:plastocyanin